MRIKRSVGESRYDGSQKPKPRKTFVYIPLVDRFRLQYRNAARAKTLVGYREELLERGQGQDELADFFHGRLYNDFHVRKLRLFQDPHDVALHMSLDRVQLTNMRHHEVTPVIFMNLNLPPPPKNVIKSRIFLLAWVTMVTGDGPGLAEAIGMKRPGNALRRHVFSTASLRATAI
jgi:hypothetical protein